MKSADRIRLDIENAIRSGALLPGDAIDEAELMRRHDVSRTPVREALLQLQAQELLQSQPRGGMVVARMDVQQLLSMWELLAELEGVCARLACERMTAQDLQELQRVHHAARPCVEADDIEAWQGHNREFHEVLYRACANPYLREEILHMRARTGAYRRHAFAAIGMIRKSWEQHERIMEALKDRQSARAWELMVSHLSPGQGMPGVTALIASLPKHLLR
ncbi:GntR family transcriptional regulator [uncultured Azohydromonas sp.]|jgi:Transcriptional regulators|uniref:GntR family transcriptional regulator n=1 Tax=uncultured Azohydromonas sp. TaxID=487342 RepID=UPI002616A5FA|nr:GntR family transcriptional regulator [uncultured Azohydromonas sp.]